MPATTPDQRRLRLLSQHLTSPSSRGAAPTPVFGDRLVAPATAAGRPRRRTTVNAAEHVWLSPTDVRYPDYPYRADKPHPTLPQRSMEQLLWQMDMYGVDKVMISHVVSLGMDNSYTAHCLKSHPDKFAATGLLVGEGMLAPDDPSVPARLEELIVGQGFSGLRLSIIYDKHIRWLDAPGTYPLWEKAQELGAVFNIFLAPEQLEQVAAIAPRFPGVKIVIDHFAMLDLSRPDSEGIDKILALSVHPNVYMDTRLQNPSQQQTPYRDMWPNRAF